MNKGGFTLIEVLLALAIIAISLTALLKVNGQSIQNAQRIKEKSISHWIAMQGVSMLQLDLIHLTANTTQATMMFGKRWYWRARTNTTPIRAVKQLIISVSPNELGPYREEVTAYLYSP